MLSPGDSCPSPAFQYHPAADSQASPTKRQIPMVKCILVTSSQMPRGSPLNLHNGAPDFPAKTILPPLCKCQPQRAHRSDQKPSRHQKPPFPSANPSTRPTADLLTPSTCWSLCFPHQVSVLQQPANWPACSHSWFPGLSTEKSE